MADANTGENQPVTQQLDPYLATRADAMKESVDEAFAGVGRPNAQVEHELEGLDAALTALLTANSAGIIELRNGDNSTVAGAHKAMNTLVTLNRIPHTTRVQTMSMSDPNHHIAVDKEIKGTQATHRALQYTYETQFEGDEETPPIDPEFLRQADELIDATADRPYLLHGLMFIAMHAWARKDRRERAEYVASLLDESPVEEHILVPARKALGVIERLKQNNILGRAFKVGHAVMPHALESTGKHAGKLVGAFTDRGMVIQNYLEKRAQKQADSYLKDDQDGIADGHYRVELTLEGIQIALSDQNGSMIPFDKTRTSADYSALAMAIALRIPLRMPEIFVDPNASNRAKQVAFFAMRCAATDLVERPDYSVLQKAAARSEALAAQSAGKLPK